MIIPSASALAANFKLNSASRIKAQISKSGLNRISMLPHRITQVTGDESKYKLKYDEDGSNIYIMPVGKIGETIELSIKSTGNLVQDMSLEVANIAGRTIILEQDQSAEYVTEIIMNEAKLMLKSMMDGRKGKYYILDNEQIIPNKLGLNIKQVKIYRWSNISGAIIEIENNSKSPITISEDKIAYLYRSVLMTAIEGMDSTISSKSKVRAYIVTLNGREV